MVHQAVSEEGADEVQSPLVVRGTSAADSAAGHGWRAIKTLAGTRTDLGLQSSSMVSAYGGKPGAAPLWYERQLGMVGQ